MTALLVYAYTLGLVAAVNPCGFALLPVYLPFFARLDNGSAPLARRIAQALGAAGGVSVGFIAVFAVIGAALSAGAAAIMAWVPWIMVVIALAMTALGVAMLSGRSGRWLPSTALPVRGRSPRSMVTFGVTYGVASLSCALPLFLAGISGAFLRVGLVRGLASVLAYALGMATVLTGLAVAISLGRGRVAWMRRLSRYVHPVGAVLLVVVGAYLAYYWVTALFAPTRAFPLTGLVDSVQATVAGWLAVAGVWLGVGLASAVALVLLVAWLARLVGGRTAVVLTLALPALVVPAGLLAGSGGVAGPPQGARTGYGSVPAALRPGRAAQLLTAYTPIRPPLRVADFTLADQRGNQVSLRDLVGRVVVLAFMDDRCTDICRQYSPDMLAAARDLGTAASKVAFVGINVNPFHTRVADVAAFTRSEHLGRLPHWRFLTGPVPRLKRVWHTYGVDVETQGHSVYHSGTIYLIDQRGRGRATMNFASSPGQTAQWGNAMATSIGNLLHVPVSTATSSTGTQHAGPGITVAQRGAAPGFRLPRLRHPAQDLTLAELRGKPAVINFWASWCVPCRQELPRIQQAAASWGDRVSIVGVDVTDQRPDALKLAAAAGIRYPLAFDQDGRVASAYRVVNLPTTVFVSADGRVVARHTGEITRADLAGAIRNLMR